MGDDPVGMLRCPHSDLASPSDAGKVPFEWPQGTFPRVHG